MFWELAALSDKKMSNKTMTILLIVAAVAVAWYFFGKRVGVPSCISGTALSHCNTVQGPSLAQLTCNAGA